MKDQTYKKILSSIEISSDIQDITESSENNNIVFVYENMLFEEGLYPVVAGTFNISRPYMIHTGTVDSFLLVYNIEGSFSVSGSSEAYTIEEGEFFIADLSKTFSVTNRVLPCTMKYCFISGASLNIYRRFSGFFRPVHPGLNSSSPLTLDPVFSFNPAPGPCECMSIHSALTGILSAYISLLFTDTGTPPSGDESSVPVYLSSVHTLLHSSSETSFSLDLLAKRFGVSKSRLCHDYKKYYGISPINDINSVRLEKAKKLLLTSSLQIQEISNSVGFEDTNHFIRLFKKKYDLTPGSFRHQLLPVR